MALAQLSCLDGYTVIFRLKVRGGREAGVFPKALKELMENEEIDLVSPTVCTPLKAHAIIDSAVFLKLNNCCFSLLPL